MHTLPLGLAWLMLLITPSVSTTSMAEANDSMEASLLLFTTFSFWIYFDLFFIGMVFELFDLVFDLYNRGPIIDMHHWKACSNHISWQLCFAL